MNSVTISLSSTTLGLMIAVPTAWAMALVPSRNRLMWMINAKMLPLVSALALIHLAFPNLRLLDTHTCIAIVMALINLPIIFWKIHTCFNEISSEILASARMDGASLKGDIIHALAPMAAPRIASTMLLKVILARNEAFRTLDLAAANAPRLTAFTASQSSPEGLLHAKFSAASTTAIAPILILIMGWFSQKQLVRGPTFGAVE
jgi:sorbitol/mannitol transport system permease protein